MAQNRLIENLQSAFPQMLVENPARVKQCVRIALQVQLNHYKQLEASEGVFITKPGWHTDRNDELVYYVGPIRYAVHTETVGMADSLKKYRVPEWATAIAQQQECDIIMELAKIPCPSLHMAFLFQIAAIIKPLMERAGIIDRNPILYLYGEAGSGKTRLLRLVNSLYLRNDGDREIFEIPLRSWKNSLYSGMQEASGTVVILDDLAGSNGVQSEQDAKKLKEMYIVGDPDQAIYEWRNANPESFLEKMHDSEWTQLVLSENFRSSQMICNATYIFSDTNKDKKANNASGPFATYNKKPVLFLYDKDTAEDLIIQRFKEECTACDISVSPDKVAIVTRSKIHSDDSIDNLWKTPETELLARASFEWMCDNRKKAYVFCERALFQMVVKDLKDIDVSIEWDVSQIIQYAKWKQVVIEILIRLPSADEECGQWVTNSRDIVHKILVSHNVAMRDGITMNDAIKIKTRDKKHPDFREIPIRCYFEIKSKAEYTYSSIHGVKGETFDALMLLIHGTVGNTLTPSFLANGKTNTELMRIAYVAMTRPRKLLVVAMPKNMEKLSNRFPPDKWDYVEL